MNKYLFLLFSVAFSQTEWTQVDIPENQNMVKLIADGNGLYGATSAASIYFSSDNGLNWESLPVHPDIFPYGVDLFEKVDDYLFFSQNIGGSTSNYRTYYNGNSWGEWEILPYDESIIYEFVNFENTIYALLNQGISVSSDYGTSWDSIDMQEITGYIHLLYVDAEYLYINHGCNLFRYNIETNELTDITGILDDIGPPEPYSCTAIHQIEKFNDKLIISMYWYGGVGTLFYSETKGDSWEIINSFPSVSSSGYGSNNIPAMAAKNGILYAGTATSQDGVFYTHNLIDWTEYSAGLSSYNLSVSALTATEDNIYKLGGTVNLFQNELSGECNGDGPAEHYDCAGNCLVELDCAGNCCVLGEEGCYWQETGPCGEEGPNNGTDSCGVCGGDNSSCADCAGVPCSDAYIDNCGVCDDIPENDCVQDCAGTWGGDAYLDNCSVCDSDPSNDCGYECGSWGGDAFLDECGVCYGDGSSCADADADGCLDDIDDAPYEWDDDYDGDGLPDDCDADDDNDGSADAEDSNDNNEYVCSDVDADTCDDCSFGMFDPYNDGPDYNENGICDEGDNNDTDGDGVLDDEDSDPFNPYQCADNDGDSCDDCSLGNYNPSDDGWDYDGDGTCDAGDADDDNDGVADENDPDDNNEFECSDYDGDTCDDCSSGTFDTTNDGEDYDGDGMCNLGDFDDDNDGTIDSEDCAPLDELASEVDCAGICGGDNSTYDNCCGIPPNEDCTDVCIIDEMGVCCMVEDLDECGICGGDNSCLCTDPFIYVSGHCLHEDDIVVLQDMIDNSMNSGYSIDNCNDQNDPWCQSPNLYMDQSENWHDVLIDGDSYQFANDNGVVEPLELGLQEWSGGRLTSIMCGAYIYCQLSGEIPESISNLTEIEVLRLEVNYFAGLVPESICGFENLNYDDNLAFDLSYNMLCEPYPECVPDGAVNYMDTSECYLNGDVNYDGSLDVLDVVVLVNVILNGLDINGGDMNGDNAVNVIDVVMLVNLILNGGS